MFKDQENSRPLFEEAVMEKNYSPHILINTAPSYTFICYFAKAELSLRNRFTAQYNAFWILIQS
jgi:hypothetical protein